MEFPRVSGILLHPTSLPGGHGIGDLGPAARSFVDYLNDAGQRLWQVLPLGPPSAGDSPYQALSSYAGNPLMISLDHLRDDGLLADGDLRGAPPNTDRADFEAAAAFKSERLRRATAALHRERPAALQQDFDRFKQESSDWLPDFALFMALKQHHGGKPWWEWPKDVVKRKPGAMATMRAELSDEVDHHEIVQFLFFRQWDGLRHYANERDIRLMGDVPIYVAHDSADVWAAPQYFAVDEDGRIETQAGVPPDYFSETGQLWGNPTYRWDVLARDGYVWWVERIRRTLRLVDLLRLDHFRGFEGYWAVPADAETAMKGEWEPGPGKELFEALRHHLGELPFVAEDLGVITEEVHALREAFGMPPMKVLQFAFCDGAQQYLPHNYDRNCVVYTGTHDTDTTRGWFEARAVEYQHLDRHTVQRERDRGLKYLGVPPGEFTWALIRLALQSVAHTVIIPLQDVLDLPNSARMNRPGQASGQWDWRVTQKQMDWAARAVFKELCELYERV